MKVKFSMKSSLWLMLLLLTSTFASGLIIPVKAAEIRVPYDYPTIQAAIDAASSGDIIIVSEGTYPEGQINVYKPLLLIADGLVIVDGLGEGQVFYVTTNDVTIRGFTIKNSKTFGLYAGITLDNVQNCKIEANIATENCWAGIYLFDSSHNVVEQNVATHNFAAGIALVYSSSNIIEANTVTNNLVGIGAIRQSNDNVYEGNTIANNVVGMDIKGSHIKVVGNTVTNNAKYGIWFHINSSQFQENTVTNNGLSGIRIDDSYFNEVEENNLTNNGLGGIDLHYSDFNVVEENMVTNNGNSGIELIASDFNVVQENIVSNNAYIGIGIGSSGIESSDGNAVKENEALGNGGFDLFWDGEGAGNIWEENTFGTKNWVDP